MADAPDTGSAVTRRGFVGWAVGMGAAFVGLVAGVPLIGSLISSNKATPGAYVQVADVALLPTGEPFALSFVESARDAYEVAQLPHSVYALKKSDTEVVVFSPVCPHLGCQVYFNRGSKTFVCPCHDSVFSLDGARTSGPAPRGLDTLPVKISKGMLLVQWIQYEPGVSQKTPV